MQQDTEWDSPQTKMWQIRWWYNVCPSLLIRWLSQCHLTAFLPLSPCKQCISATWNPAIWILPEQTGNPSHTAPFSGLHLQDMWSGVLSCHPHLFQSPSPEPSSACRATREKTVSRIPISTQIPTYTPVCWWHSNHCWARAPCSSCSSSKS